MKWLSNTIDPQVARYSHMTPLSGQTRQQAFIQWQNWLSDKAIGDPKATEKYSVAQLKAQSMVGVYLPE